MHAHILILEDNPTNLELMVFLLQSFGFETSCAGDGQEALGSLGLMRPDLIICDLEMPVMDGYEFARRVRADPELRGIPMVAVSAYAMVGDRERIMAHGFDSYITKPVDPENFVKLIEHYLPVTLRSQMEMPPAVNAPPAPRPQLQGKVLVVDDSATNLGLIRATLEPFGYEVVSTSRVDDARKMVGEFRPDLILSDLHMAPTGGLQLLHWVKSEPKLRDLPFIMCSASFANEAERDAARELGADRFLNRPIDPEVLLAEIEACLRIGRERAGAR